VNFHEAGVTAKECKNKWGSALKGAKEKQVIFLWNRVMNYETHRAEKWDYLSACLAVINAWRTTQHRDPRPFEIEQNVRTKEAVDIARIPFKVAQKVRVNKVVRVEAVNKAAKKSVITPSNNARNIKETKGALRKIAESK